MRDAFHRGKPLATKVLSKNHFRQSYMNVFPERGLVSTTSGIGESGN
jgi:hypothetical protein